MVNPTYVDFSIYPYCNLRCDFCYAEAECESTISNHLLKVSDFEDIFEQFDQIGILRVGFEGGEPFLRKDWFEILKLADKHYFNYFVNLKRLKTLDDQTIQASNPERFSLWDWCLYLCIKAQVKGILVL